MSVLSGLPLERTSKLIQRQAEEFNQDFDEIDWRKVMGYSDSALRVDSKSGGSRSTTKTYSSRGQSRR